MQIDTKELKGALKALSGVTSKGKEALYSHIFFRTQGSSLFMEVANATLSKRVPISYKGEPLEFNCNYKALSEFLKILQGESIELTLRADNITLSSLHQKIILKQFDPSEQMLFISDESMDGAIDEDITLSDSLISAIDKNNKKFELNGMLIDLEHCALVATNTRRLEVVYREFSSSKSQDIKELIIPKDALIGSHTLRGISFNKTTISFVNPNGVEVTAKLIIGKYPQYQRIIPKSPRITIRANGLEIKEHLKPLKAKELLIKHKRDTMSLSYYESDQLIDIAKIGCEYGSDLELSYSLDARYLFDAIDKNEITIMLSDYNMPISIESRGAISVIMPIVTDYHHPHTIETVATDLAKSASVFNYKTPIKQASLKKSSTQTIKELKEQIQELKKQVEFYKRDSKSTTPTSNRVSHLHKKVA